MSFPVRSTRHHRNRQPGRIPAIAIVGICFAVAVLITLIVGNLLKVWLDDETYQKLTDTAAGDNPTATAAVKNTVRQVCAYPFALGDNVENVIGKNAVSVAINTSDGTLLYVSDVGNYLGLASGESAASLYDTLGELSAFVPYVSGIFYPQAFREASADLRYAATVQEGSLLREFLRAGGGELLLCGLSFDTVAVEDIVEYVRVIKEAVGDDVPVGVAIPCDLAMASENWKTVALLLEACDFCALDVREAVAAGQIDGSDLDEAGISPAADAFLQSCSYYLTQCGMRLLLSSSQSALLSTVEMRSTNYQVAE
jgi:hypothetical protein